MVLFAAGLGCGSPRACDSMDFTWDDQRCGTNGTCTQVGDGTQYSRCTEECLCPPERQYCSVLGLYSSGDYVCNAVVQVCMATPRQDCPNGSPL